MSEEYEDAVKSFVGKTVKSAEIFYDCQEPEGCLNLIFADGSELVVSARGPVQFGVWSSEETELFNVTRFGRKLTREEIKNYIKKWTAML